MKDSSILRFNPMTVVVLGMVSLTVGILTFWETNVELMSNLSGGLATFTGATFGIIGIWLTLLNPLRVFDEKGPINDSKQRLVNKLRPFFKLSIATFAVSIVLRLVIAVAPPAIQTLSQWFVALVELLAGASITLPPAATEWIYLVARTSIGSVLMFLYIVQVVVILANLLPLFDSEKREREREWEQAKGTRKHQSAKP